VSKANSELDGQSFTVPYTCRFLGTDPEPRPGLSSGHIPHSFSLPFTAFLQTRTIPNSSVQYTTFLPLPDLRNALVSHVGDHAEAVIQGKRPIITSCGSGMTAGVLWLGLKLLNVPNVALYDEVSHDLREILRVINVC
jgi:thiosulfate/3-mercaptopyruvate sulfurtransferase